MDGFARLGSSGSSAPNQRRRISQVSLDAGKLRDDVVEMATKAATSVQEAIHTARRHSNFGVTPEKASDPSKIHEDLTYLKQKRKHRQEGRKEEIKKFHESLRKLEGMRYHRQGPVAVLAVVSVLLGVLVNELCVASDYVPQLSDAMVEQIETADGRACNDKAGDPLKVLVTLSSIVLMWATWKQWQLKAEISIQRQQLEDWMYLPGGGLDRTAVPLATYARLILELIVCAVHPLPYVRSDWKFTVETDSSVYYRFESVTVAIMVARLYHLWRWFYLMATYKFTNLEDSFLVKDYTTVERMSETNSSIAHTTFPLKVMMSIHPVRVIVCVVGTLFLSITYLVRLTEGPAGQRHSGNWWDQLWVTITQGTTGYGGSPPWTQFGRLCAVLMMLIGPMTVSVMTAATTKSITLNQEEGRVFRSMQRNTLRVAVLTAAARIVQFWWRQKVALRRIGYQAPRRSTNIAVAFLSAIATGRGGSLSLRARHTFENARHRSSSGGGGFFGLGASGHLGMIKEVSAVNSAPPSRSNSARAPAALHSPRPQTAPGGSPAARAGGGAGVESPRGRQVEWVGSPSQTPRNGNGGREAGRRGSGGAGSTGGGGGSQTMSLNSSGSAPPRAAGRQRRGSIVSFGVMSGGSGEQGGAGSAAGAKAGMRGRFGQFASLKHLVPFWEEDAKNKKVQLLRNFYVALEEYDRFLARNKGAFGEAEKKAEEGGRMGREERSGSLFGGSVAGESRPGSALATPVNWQNGRAGLSNGMSNGMRGSRRRVSESMVAGQVIGEYGRVEGGVGEEKERWHLERKLHADVELVQREVQFPRTRGAVIGRASVEESRRQLEHLRALLCQAAPLYCLQQLIDVDLICAFHGLHAAGAGERGRGRRRVGWTPSMMLRLGG